MAISDTRFDARFPGMTLEDHLALARVPRLAPEKQWWNVPAKYAKAKQIADDERRRSILEAHAAGFADAHDNRFDAMRHARWSQRMSTEIGPVSARLFGAVHEFENGLPSPETLSRWHAPSGLQDLAALRDWHEQPEAEGLMDRRNNAEGRRAAAQGRTINPGNLQTSIGRSPPAGNPAYRTR
jgi:uncharacterized protein DUF6973